MVNIGKALLRASGYEWIDSGVLSTDQLGGAQTRKRYFLVASKVGGGDDGLTISSVARRLKQDARSLQWAIGDLLTDQSVAMKTGIMDTVPALSAENLARIRHLFENDLHDLPDDARPDCHKKRAHLSIRLRPSLVGPAVADDHYGLHDARARTVHPPDLPTGDFAPRGGPHPVISRHVLLRGGRGRSSKQIQFVKMDRRRGSASPGICGDPAADAAPAARE